ncbi:MAG: futalosine hydrolase [Saprospiraceae bacterium]|nr:futalosine hydrolase [Saprospiraceae bacterium]MDW8485273.1 futalosine hydrolase [Saprospiraceae bacterium]
MHILLVAATPFEIAPLLAHLERHFEKSPDGTFTQEGLSVFPLVTGVGPVVTAWHLGRFFARYRPDWALHLGVAGAFDRSLALGEVVQIVADRFADVGVEEADGRFIDIFELGLANPNEPPFEEGWLRNVAGAETPFLPTVTGITVSRVHGSEHTIKAIEQKYPQAQVETMESAAFFYACLQAELPFSEIRSLSNYVEPRRREAWKLDLAIEQLNAVAIEMLQFLSAPLA